VRFADSPARIGLARLLEGTKLADYNLGDSVTCRSDALLLIPGIKEMPTFPPE
jgi:hypothetical protein